MGSYSVKMCLQPHTSTRRYLAYGHCSWMHGRQRIEPQKTLPGIHSGYGGHNHWKLGIQLCIAGALGRDGSHIIISIHKSERQW